MIEESRSAEAACVIARERQPNLDAFGLRGQAQRDPALGGCGASGRLSHAKAPSPLRSAGALQNCALLLAFALPIFCAALLTPLTASALILTGRGNDPVRDPGWPDGALEVANLESRVGWWEGPPFGGGEWQFLYRGDTETFNQALGKFAAIRGPLLDLVIHDGPQETTFLKAEKDSSADTRVDWTFTVWVPANWHHLYNNPKSVFGADRPQFRQPVDPPRLDVYIGGGQVDWAKVKVPDNVRVRDERASVAEVVPVGGAVVRVDAYDMATGKPAKEARVIIARIDSYGALKAYMKVAEAVCGAAGHAEITKIPAGTYRVIVEVDGYATRMLDNERFGERTFKKFRVELARFATIRGTVMDSNGKPVEGVKVSASTVMALDGRGYAMPETPVGVTDNKGIFVLTNLPNGFTQFHIYEEGYYFGDLFTIHDVPGTNVVLRLTSAGGLQITVRDKDGQRMSRFEGKPINVSVEPVEGSKVGSWGGGGTVKDDGTIEFKNMPPGQYRLTSRPNPANSNRKYTSEQIVTVKPGDPVVVKMIYE